MSFPARAPFYLTHEKSKSMLTPSPCPGQSCFDTCQPWLRPTQPPCLPAALTVAPPPSLVPSAAPTACVPGIMCVAGVNECGTTFSG